LFLFPLSPLPAPRLDFPPWRICDTKQVFQPQCLGFRPLTRDHCLSSSGLPFSRPRETPPKRFFCLLFVPDFLFTVFFPPPRTTQPPTLPLYHTLLSIAGLPSFFATLRPSTPDIQSISSVLLGYLPAPARADRLPFLVKLRRPFFCSTPRVHLFPQKFLFRPQFVSLFKVPPFPWFHRSENFVSRAY